MTESVRSMTLIVGQRPNLTPAITILEDDVVDAIGQVIKKHREDFMIAAAQFGIDFDTVAMPDWYRFVTIDEARGAVASYDRTQERA